MKRLTFTAMLGSAISCGGVHLGTRVASAQPANAGGFLEGTAAWDMTLVQEYFKKTHGYEIEVPAQPAPFANQDVLEPLNPEFKHRIEAVMAVCQGLGSPGSN